VHLARSALGSWKVKNWEQVVRMSLGLGIEELWEAVRDRVEVSGDGPVWRVTAGSFESALGYARARFPDPTVLDRTDRNRLWPRVTLTVTTDAVLGGGAPPLEDLERAVPTQPTRRPSSRPDLPPSLEAIFVHQEALRTAAHRADV
jgi:hypothetical protein